MSQKTLSMTFITDLWIQNFLFTGESVCFHFMARSEKPMFSSFANISSLKHASPYMSHILLWILHDFYSSANKNFIDIPLFKPGTLWFAVILNSLKIIFARLK